jgi:import inner membrane translocase subunit TIM21
MLVTFWVHGRGRDEPEPLGWIKGVWNGVEENLRWIGGVMGVSEPHEPGQVDLVSSNSSSASPKSSSSSTDSSSGGWFSGLTGSLRGGLASRSGGESRRGLPPPGTYKIGEVKAEYVKVSFVNLQIFWLELILRTHLVNIPSYRSLSMSPTQERHIQGKL